MPRFGGNGSVLVSQVSDIIEKLVLNGNRHFIHGEALHSE